MRVIEVLGYKGSEQILLALLKEDGQSFSKLASLTKYSTTASRTLKMLRKEGLVERIVQQDELRTVVYKLTKNGRDVAEMLVKLNAVDRS